MESGPLKTMKMSKFIPRRIVSIIAVLIGGGLCIATFSFADTLPVMNDTIAQPAAPVSPAKPATRIWNLQDADLLSVIDEVSRETGKSFIVDPAKVSGKVTLISTKPLKQSEVYQVFLSVLGVLGYSAIEDGNTVKIIPNMESGENATAIATNNIPGAGDQTVVRVIPLQNVVASQLMPAIRPMLPQWSNVAVYTPGNVLIIMGHANNIQRIVDIITDVDKSTSNGIQVVPLKHASASQVASVLNNLQNAARSTGESPSVSIAVDDRSNSLLLGGPKAMRVRMRVLISQLDAPSSTPSGNTEVIYLRYQQAKSLAPLLAKVAANILGKGNLSTDASNPIANAVNATPQVSLSTASANSNSSNGSNGTNDYVKDSDVQAAAAEIVTNSTTIQADPSTNAVIITAPPALMQALKAVIRKLDIRPAQVLVEAIIAEVDESNIASLGIQWGSVTSTNSDGTTSTTGTGPGLVSSFPELGAGVVGIIPSVQIQAILSVLQSQTGVDILSTPSIVVLDNQKATIEIGSDVPTQNGSYASTVGATTATPFNTFDYKKVTLKLDVMPQINLGSSVRLTLNLKNDTLQNPQNPTTTPLINTSNIANAVIVNSNDVLVLGGLISNSNNESINKVPILGDVPIIGKLFQQKTKNQQKKNLMVFLKPIIMDSRDDAMLISEMKYNAVRSQQANFRDDLREIGDKPVPTLLPPWKNRKDLPKPFEAKK